ncbi:unnamed protein product [Brassicogethes aeneus]|uniref:C2H2-type domain-containing protein n=1 Tax=Brassicogethes aeneus TaxID=1431903 RepID=A0A9P0ARN0_BRAAE|nr:unnamed protein product [Brassicogethes aeneus]
MDYQYQGFNYESYPGGSAVVEHPPDEQYNFYTALIKTEEKPETYVYEQNNFVINGESDNQESWYSPTSSSSDVPEEERCNLQELTTVVPQMSANVIPQENYAYNNIVYAAPDNLNGAQYMLPSVSYVQPQTYTTYEAPYMNQYVAPMVTNEQVLTPQNSEPQGDLVTQPYSSEESNASEYFSAYEQPIEDSESEKFKCAKCNRTFTKACYLTQHKNAQHNDKKLFKCGKCGKKFASQDILDEHSEKHSENKPHKCTMCKKQYNFRADLTRHMFVHNKKNSPFVCTVCNKGFARKDHLKNHYLVHTKKTAVKVSNS